MNNTMLAAAVTALALVCPGIGLAEDAPKAPKAEQKKPRKPKTSNGPKAATPGQPASAGQTGTPPREQAQPLSPGAAAAATTILVGLGQTEAPGAQPDGVPFAGQFQQGQTLEQPINLQPGKCYTVVAAGMGPQQLAIQIVAQPAPMFPPTVLAQSDGSTATPVVGGKQSGCFKTPVPIGGPAKIVLKAVSGAGMAAGQVYVK